MHGNHFVEDIFQLYPHAINVCILIRIPLKLVPEGPTVKGQHWSRQWIPNLGDKSLSEPTLILMFEAIRHYQTTMS